MTIKNTAINNIKTTEMKTQTNYDIAVELFGSDINGFTTEGL
jgi:hypothetical protein